MVEGTPTTSTTTGTTTTHVATLPTGIIVGELLFVILGSTQSGSVETPVGWTRVSGFVGEQGFGDSGNGRPIGFYRTADGTEGASVTFTVSDASTMANALSVAFRISGAEPPSAQAPQQTGIVSVQAATDINPPSITPTGGTKEYLFIAAGNVFDGFVASSAPANYTGFLTTSSGGGPGHPAIGLSVARRALTVSSEDPGVFGGNYTGSNGGWSRTFAIHPKSVLSEDWASVIVPYRPAAVIPSAPSPGSLRVYARDGEVYKKNSSDEEFQIGPSRIMIGGWGRIDVAANLTDAQLVRDTGGGTSTLPVLVMRAGSITGIWVAASTARTGGTLTVEVWKNGVATGLTAVLNATNTTYKTTTQLPELDTIAAGDRLDIRITTDASWTPATADIEAGLEITNG
jgi:hypothetical protein